MTTTTNNEIDWVEKRNDELIQAARRSEWKKEIFNDADWLIEDGYATDVALKISCDYWLR